MSKPHRRLTKYDIADEFSRGFVAAVAMASCRLISESDHWLAGWDAGYSCRAHKNEKLNSYLVDIGHQPMAVVHLAKGGA